MKTFLPFLLAIALLGSGCSAGQPLTNNSPSQPTVAKGTELNLSGRGLTSIPMDIFSRTDLTRLDLSNNRLTDAPPSQIGQLKNLTSLDLSGNGLTGLPAELGQLTKLETLNASNNKLTGLPMELGNLTQLRTLNLSGNPYSTRDLDEIATKLTTTDIRR